MRDVSRTGTLDFFTSLGGCDQKPQHTQISRHRTRELLRQAMENQGLLVYPFEWWHFDYVDWPKYPILNITFDDLLRKVPE